MAASDRAQITVSASYPSSSSVYGSSSPATFSSVTSIPMTPLEPVIGAAVTITNRDAGSVNPYLAETGSTTISSPVTDAGGNVPGWLDSGSYTITIAAQGAYPGGTHYFESARGDGVTLIAPGAVTTATIANGAVSFPQLAADLQALFNSLEGLLTELQSFTRQNGGATTGTIIHLYSQGSIPSGWLRCTQGLVEISAYPALFGVLGYNFSLPYPPIPTGFFNLPPAIQPPDVNQADVDFGLLQTIIKT